MRKLMLTRNLLVNDKITAWYQKKVCPSMLPFVLAVSFIHSREIEKRFELSGVRVTGSSKKITESKIKKQFLLHSEHFNQI